MSNDLQFFDTLRAALGVPRGAERTKSVHPELFAKKDKKDLLNSIGKRSEAETEELKEILLANCKGLHIDLHMAESLEEATDITVEIVRRKDPEFSHNRHVILHDHPDIAVMQLWKRFNRESVTLHTTFAADSETREKTLASYIGITAPSIGVADSATLIQLTSPGCPRSTSLVPSIHIALLRSSCLVANLEEAYAILEKMAPKESFVFISGPSKTADIEAQLVLGAHGPRELHLILLSDQHKGPSPKDAPVVEVEKPDKEVAAERNSDQTEQETATVATREAETSEEPDENVSKEAK